MKKVLILITVLVLVFSVRLNAETNDVKTKFATELQQRLTKVLMTDITPIVSHIKDGSVSLKESYSLRNLLDLATRDVLHEKSAIERQQIVINLLGKSDYDRVCSYYKTQCQSAFKPDVRQLAADMLGHRLFSIESRDVLISLALSEERQTQFFAVISLACIGEKGACNLLHYMIMSEWFGDIEGSYAMEALGVANDPKADKLALTLCLATNSGPMMVSACLPLFKNEPRFFEIVGNMLKRDRFTPPKRKQALTVSELQQFRVLSDIFRIMNDNVERLTKDEALLKKIREYAESNDVYYTLCDRALFLLKDAGMEHAYFKSLLDKPGVPEQKQEYLRKILILIEKKSSTEVKGAKVNLEGKESLKN